ncbi:MAG TPA: hypothetical protein VK614_01915 [Allosphingosinicella sp.]|nr:hypothetical protein [Allosphingosinicella sp.]
MSDHPAPAEPEDYGGEPDLFEVRITGSDEELAKMLREFDLDVGCRHAHVDRNPDGSATILVFASEARIADLIGAGYRAERGANASARGRELWREIGRGDRFEGGRIPPRGLGDKGGYEPKGERS